MAKRERVQPHDLDAERAVLGSVIINYKLLPLAQSKVRPGDMFRKAHAIIFEHMLKMAEDGVVIDLMTTKSALETSGILDDIGGAAYLAALIDGVPKATNVEHYANIVAEKSRLRSVIAMADMLAKRAYDGEPVSDLIEYGIPKLSSLAVSGGSMVFVDDAIWEYYNAVVSGTMAAPISSGLVDLDIQLDGGFRRGDFSIIAARPSIGKTALATGIAEHAARVAGVRSVLFSLEMSQMKIAARILSMRARVSAQRVANGDVTGADAQRVVEAVEMERVPFLMECTAKSVPEVSAWIRKAKREHGDVAVVVIDYIQLLGSDRRRNSDEAEMASISRGLKQVAKDEDVALIALSQLSRSPEGRKDKRPQLSDLRGSGALEQDCDVCLLLYRSDAEDHAGTAEVIVAKNRDGAKGVVRLAFVEHLAMFADLAQSDRQ